MAIKYTGDKPSNVAIGDRPIMPGDTISGPADLLEYLKGRDGFEEITEKPKRATKPKAAENEEE